MLTQPGAPQPPLSLQWATGYVDIDPLTRVCTVQLSQGAVDLRVRLSAADLRRLGNDLLECARRASTDLSHAAAVPDAANGKPTPG